MISSAQSVTQPAPSVVCVVSQCCGFCGTCSAACGTTNPLPWTTLGAQLPRHRGTTSPNCPGSASNARPSAALPVDGRRWPDARRGAHPAIGIPAPSKSPPVLSRPRGGWPSSRRTTQRGSTTPQPTPQRRGPLRSGQRRARRRVTASGTVPASFQVRSS